MQDNDRKTQETKFRQDLEAAWTQMQGLKERMNLVEELNNCFKSQTEDIKRETTAFFDELVTFRKKQTTDLHEFRRDLNNEFLAEKEYTRTIAEQLKQ